MGWQPRSRKPEQLTTRRPERRQWKRGEQTKHSTNSSAKYKSPAKSRRETSPESSSSELITLTLAYPAAHWPKQTCRTKRTARRLQLILPTSVPVGGAAALRTAQNAYPLA
ncbi:hypothetical protein NDU88_007805 [Pleurodeles waltl]|uniref:Uncharacterized protein n=1 Tax=Pleurodeles waltl TaxID=8319 RepID=A0AAV7N5A9_PLEWA|nr:hypothetical protein NDU88_007805 [Pleurodeles waltl]